ncbi:MAG: RNA 2',3'-cyclic phosphodiesterase [Thermoplasmata archaeon]|nr:RNA 2',3'-cyclic phosphodiesterase [Thermoplasmata archaeon]
MTFRGFIAVDVPSSPSLERLAGELRNASPSLKVVRTDQVHLTVKFLGDTEDGLVPEIITAIQEACVGVRPFGIRVHGTGAFPSLGRMGVIWVGVEGAEPIARIAERLEESLEALGFPRERRAWKPHVTLARVKGGRNPDRARAVVAAHAEESFSAATVDAIHLKKSVLTPQGAEYSIVESVGLAG